MTEEQRRRAEFVGATSSALLHLREVEASASIRASDLFALRGRLPAPDGEAGLFLKELAEDLCDVVWAAQRAMAAVRAVSVPELADQLGPTDVEEVA